MRKLTLLFVSIMLCFETFGQHKVRVEKVDPDSTDQEVVIQRTRANHWSIGGTIGAGWLDGDQILQTGYMFPRTWAMLNGTIDIEYTFSPIWGMYLEYLYNPYGGKSRYLNINSPSYGIDRELPFWNPTPGVSYEFKGINHEIAVGASLNILNLFYKTRSQKWQWYLNGGIGFSFFKMKEHGYGADDLQIMPGSDGGFVRSVSFPIATTLEWNATRWLAVVAKAEYRFHEEDNYDASVRGNSDDNTIYGGIGLRWKINSLKNRNLSHVRDMTMSQFMPASDAALKNAIDSIKNDVGDLKKKVNNLIPRVNALEKDMDKLRDTDEDGVPDIRDRHPNTPPGTKVNYWGEPIQEDIDNKYHNGNTARPIANPNDINGDGIPNYLQMGPDDDLDGDGIPNSQDPDIDGDGIPNEKDPTPYGYVTTAKPTTDENCLSVYYPTSVFAITPVSQITLAEVARIMAADPSVKLQIKSYADEQGVKSGFNNQKLTDNRAKAVKQVLVKEYGINPKRIIEVKGFGAIKGQYIDYMPNRRSDMCFVK
jgi:outer membrane protein OmpA-like peptidoglycan-associated protein